MIERDPTLTALAVVLGDATRATALEPTIEGELCPVCGMVGRPGEQRHTLPLDGRCRDATPVALWRLAAVDGPLRNARAAAEKARAEAQHAARVRAVLELAREAFPTSEARGKFLAVELRARKAVSLNRLTPADLDAVEEKLRHVADMHARARAQTERSRP